MTDKHQVKYFFFDIDETLVPKLGDQVMPDSTKRALQELRAEGHFCSIATGRPQYMVVKFCEQMGFDTFVSDGGNGITINGELISLTSMPIEICARLADQCDEEGFPWAVSTENQAVRYTKYTEFRDVLSNILMEDIIRLDLDIRQCSSIYKLFIDCKEGQESQLPFLRQVNWERATPELIVVEPGNKELGIKKVMDYYHAPHKDVVVFGDEINDFSMFQPEWTNIAMGNAIPELKEKADFVTLDSADDGIVYALKHYGWIK